MPLQLQFTDQLVNVHWGVGGRHFLYSGADGMFGSSNGMSWTKAKTSVSAVSLAWIDDVWLGAGPDGVWRSEDGAATWDTVDAPAFFEVAAMKPKTGEDGKAKRGLFAGWTRDDEGDNQIIYVSRDLGETWDVELTIPTTVGVDGYELIRGFSGCGGAFFVCTVRGATVSHNGDGVIYSSAGNGFVSQLTFGPGTDPGIGSYPRDGYSASAVGFDEKTDTYIAVGGNEYRPNDLGQQDSFLIYALSSTASFGTSKGVVAASASQTTGIGTFISPMPSAAGGSGRHVAGLARFTSAAGGSFVSGDLEAGFIPAGFAPVRSMGGSAGGYIRSFCFKRQGEASTDDDDEGGVFACVAFDSNSNGGVYVAGSGISSTAGEEFAQTHAGTAIDNGGSPGAAVAVGKLSFL